jgi:hypothetical protein
MKRISLAAAAVAIAVAAGAGAAAKIAVGGSSSTSARHISPARFGQPQERVPATAFDGPSNMALRSARTGASGLDRISTLGGVDFYRSTRDDGATCFAMSSLRGNRDQIGDLACLKDAFVSIPLIDMSGFGVEILPGGGQEVSVESVQGFAADEVEAVGLMGAHGVLVKTPVVNGAYLLPSGRIPDEPVQAIVALDGVGNVVYTKPVE